MATAEGVLVKQQAEKAHGKQFKYSSYKRLSHPSRGRLLTDSFNEQVYVDEGEAECREASWRLTFPLPIILGSDMSFFTRCRFIVVMW